VSARVKLARYLPSLLDAADERKAVAGKLGAAAGDLHLGSDASETMVKRTALNNCRVVHLSTHGLVAGDVASRRTVARAHPAKAAHRA
jgi:CHAT domain-containing protein